VRAQLRASAERDIDDAVAYYLAEPGPETALDFIESLEEAITQLCDFPLIGSLRFAFELEIPDLRSSPLQRFPHLLFYVPADNHIDVWRLLHARRDIPAFLTADPDGLGNRAIERLASRLTKPNVVEAIALWTRSGASDGGSQSRRDGPVVRTRLGLVPVPVAGIDRSKDFYVEQVGFDLKGRRGLRDHRRCPAAATTTWLPVRASGAMAAVTR
jgi:toxin ParE1/3/4